MKITEHLGQGTLYISGELSFLQNYSAASLKRDISLTFLKVWKVQMLALKACSTIPTCTSITTRRKH